MTKRTEVIQLRVSTEEKAALRAAAGDKTLSEYLRFVALGSPTTIVEEVRKLDGRAVRQAVEAEVRGESSEGPQFRCPIHKNEVRSSPTGRCFCNRKTSEAV